MINKEQVILDAAEKAFADKGYKETSVRTIALNAHINSSMLNYYFQTKEKLFHAVLQRRLQHFSRIGSIASLHEMHAREKLLTVIQWHVKRIVNNLALFRFILREYLISSTPETRHLINRYLSQRLKCIQLILSEGIKKGEFKQVDIEMTSIAITGYYTNCLISPTLVSATDIPVSIINRMFVFFEHYVQSFTI